MRFEKGAVAIAMGPMREFIVQFGLPENRGKMEKVGRGGWQYVVGADFWGGMAEPEEELRMTARRETLEEFGYAFDVKRFRRILPDPVLVEQLRGGERMTFSVVCFALRIADSEMPNVLGDKIRLLDNPDNLRPRDHYLLELSSRHL